jgi:hypothetical protein
LYTVSNIPAAAAAAGIARISQVNSFFLGQVELTVYQQYLPNRSPPAKQGRMPCWANSLRPFASVVVPPYASPFRHSSLLPVFMKELALCNLHATPSDVKNRTYKYFLPLSQKILILKAGVPSTVL